MRTRRMFGPTLLAFVAIVLTGLFSVVSVSAQAVSSLPVAIYQGTCSSDSIEHVVDLDPIVPAASIGGATFGGSDQAIDVASSTTSLEATLSDLLANGPFAIIVASGTGEDASELACGVIGGSAGSSMTTRSPSGSTMSMNRASPVSAAWSIWARPFRSA